MMNRQSARAAHLLSIDDLGREGIIDLLDSSESIAAGVPQEAAQVCGLSGKTIATVFFERSTRTRLSFELAAKRLGVGTLNFDVSSSSMAKGESLRDTLQTVDALGVDAIVIRHRSSGVPVQASRWVNASVINAGDGQHEHPTQALVDVFTMREELRRRGARRAHDFSGMKVSIVGDIRHSRVARSNVLALGYLGAEVTLVAPVELQPISIEGWPIVKMTSNLDAVLASTEVCYLLRIQHERISDAGLGDLAAYRRAYGLTIERAAQLSSEAMIMHPGPLNRGVEIDSVVADLPNALIKNQVRNGVPVRMAVLGHLLGPSTTVATASGACND